MRIAAFLVSFSLLDFEKAEEFKNDEKRLKETGESDSFAYGFHCAIQTQARGFNVSFYLGCFALRDRLLRGSFGLLCWLASYKP